MLPYSLAAVSGSRLSEHLFPGIFASEDGWWSRAMNVNLSEGVIDMGEVSSLSLM